MKSTIKLIVTVLVLTGFFIPVSIAQEYDLLIKNGHLIDPKNNRNAVMDVAVLDGKISEIGRDLPAQAAKEVIDASGMYVVPGLIDMHVHVFWGTEPDAYIGDSYTSVQPDAFSFRSGVTTMVDTGSPGWRTFEKFREQTIEHSATRVLTFLNIVGFGMKGGQIEQNLRDMDPEMTSFMANKYPEYIVGIKVAHYSGPEWDPVERAVEAGKISNVPVMIDFGGHTPELSLERLLLEKLRPGDIFTHAYAHVRGRTPVVDENGKVRDYVWKAQERGIVFDVGHGGGSFLFSQALPAMEQKFFPDAISTDLHTGSMNGGMKNMLNVMSKFLNMGMSLDQVIERSTWYPARYIQREDLGHLSKGAEADIAVLSLAEGEFGYIDTGGWKIRGNKKLVCELTLMSGEVMWDLNGLSKPVWESEE